MDVRCHPFTPIRGPARPRFSARDGVSVPLVRARASRVGDLRSLTDRAWVRAGFDRPLSHVGGSPSSPLCRRVSSRCGVTRCPSPTDLGERHPLPSPGPSNHSSPSRALAFGARRFASGPGFSSAFELSRSPSTPRCSKTPCSGVSTMRRPSRSGQPGGVSATAMIWPIATCGQCRQCDLRELRFPSRPPTFILGAPHEFVARVSKSCSIPGSGTGGRPSGHHRTAPSPKRSARRPLEVRAGRGPQADRRLSDAACATGFCVLSCWFVRFSKPPSSPWLRTPAFSIWNFSLIVDG